MNRNFKEFIEFLKSDSPVSEENSGKVIEPIRKDLNPSGVAVFGKLILIHLFVGTSTLFVCPQFGNGSWLWQGHGLMGIFMRWGQVGCALGCGATFLSCSLWVSSFVLRSSEIKKLQRTVLLQVFLLSALSLTALMLVGDNSEQAFAALWLLGAFLGGLISGGLGWVLRYEIKRIA